MKILFITATRIGDAVLSTGLLAYLLERHPEATVTIACGPLPAPLFAAVPRCDRLISVAKRRRGLHWFGVWRATAGTRWDLIVDLRNSIVGRIVPARRRHIAGRARKDRHQVEELAALLDVQPPPAPTIWTDAEQESRAARLIPAGPPVLAVGPTAAWPAKQWRAARFNELIARLTAADSILAQGRIAVFGAPNERKAAEPVIEAIPPERRIDLVGKTDLATVAACLKRCAFYIGNDSGLMHLAAAAGVPTLGLFGPSPAVRFAPWGSRCAVAQTSIPFEDLVGAPEFDHRNSETLMDSLGVDAAAAAANSLWRRCAGIAA